MLSDLNYAFRQLRKSPGFTTVTLLTLALCIGANTAIFSVVYAMILKPLPFANPNQIVEIYNSYPKMGENHMPSNLAAYMDYKQHASSYQSVGLWRSRPMLVGMDGAVAYSNGANITADIFDLLQIHPLVGQFFTLKNSTPGEQRVVVLTQTFWETHFSADPEVVGKTMQIDSRPYTIVGVAPRSLEAFDPQMQFVIPLYWQPKSINPQQRHVDTLPMFARLKPGVTISQAQAEGDLLEKRFYDNIAAPWLRDYIDNSGARIRIVVLQEDDLPVSLRSSLYLLQTGVLFVLLIGCVNVANLFLARSLARQAELAVRTALGASRGRIARQLLVESLVLTGIGTALGVGLAWSAVSVMNHYTVQVLDTLPFSIDRHVLGFTGVISFAVGVCIGVMPVARLWRINLIGVIHRNSHTASADLRLRTLGNSLIVAQIATALILLTGAGLLVRSYAKALAVDPGFDARQMVAGRIALTRGFRANVGAARGFEDRLVGALNEIPGAQAVALSSGKPFGNDDPVVYSFDFADSPLPPGSTQPLAHLVRVSIGYFEMMHMPLIAGRFLEPIDLATGHNSCVVDEKFAQRFFPNRSAIGERLTYGATDNPVVWITIVGVVRNVPYTGLDDRSAAPVYYTPLFQGPRYDELDLFVRSPRPSSETISFIRDKLKAIDPAIPLYEAGSMQSFVDESFRNRRSVMLLLAGFAGLALFLSALGIYGVLAYDVSRRTREIGIRGALGATQRQIIELILGQGLSKIAIGLFIGLIGALMLSRYITSLLFDLKPTDPSVYVTGLLILLSAAVLASYLPARHAVRINPIDALRNE
jgi:putative ABC transport system permease protein